jgi:hypothetical protein
MARKSPSLEKQRREAYRSWIKWLPVVAIPFSVLFFEAWLNNETWENDLVYLKVMREHKQLSVEWRAIETQTAGLLALDRLQRYAADLGLVEPEPKQIEVVRYQPGFAPSPTAMAAQASESGDGNAQLQAALLDSL